VHETSIKHEVRDRYAREALKVRNAKGSACCGSSASTCGDPITSALCADAKTGQVPTEALAASLGCGNPTALAELKAGEIALDLGSGGGIDVLLSARRVGPAGKPYGLDMTDEMLELAHDDQRKARVTSVESVKGQIEYIPLPDESVDVIISNCVINLSASKDRVLKEAFRVPKPGGRLAVSDIVVRGEMPNEIRDKVELWVGCIAGALEDQEYEAKLGRAGFKDIELEPTRVYKAAQAKDLLRSIGPDAERVAAAADGKFASAFIRARKPAAL
jgi:ubiquinone/menaquinone biosynthesis C-methylase UbiE